MDGKLTLQEKAVEAAARFLRIRGYEMLATEWRPHEAKGAIDLVARDPESDELVFVDVAARKHPGEGFGGWRNDRKSMEALAVSWLAESGFGESVGVRFDKIGLVVVGEDRARRGLGPPGPLGQAPSGRRGPPAEGSPRSARPMARRHPVANGRP